MDGNGGETLRFSVVMIWFLIQWWVAGRLCSSLVGFSIPVYIPTLHLKKSLRKKQHRKSQVLHRRHSFGRLATGPFGYRDSPRHAIRWGELTRVPAGEWRECNVLEQLSSDQNPDLGGRFKCFYFQPYLGKIPIFTNVFQRGWNHQLGHFFAVYEEDYDKPL